MCKRLYAQIMKCTCDPSVQPQLRSQVPVKQGVDNEKCKTGKSCSGLLKAVSSSSLLMLDETNNLDQFS